MIINSGEARGGGASLQTKTKTYTPTTSQQTETVTADNGYDGLQEVDVTVNAMPSGSVTAPSSITGAGATLTANVQLGGILLAKEVSVTPNVTQAGYISNGTAGNSNVSLRATCGLRGQSTITPTSNDQTIASNTYIYGQQIIEGIVYSNLTAANIKKDVVVKIGTATDDDSVTTVTGTYAGGSSNIVQGTFTTGSTAGNGTVALNYTGSGYPIAAMVYVDGGVYNSAITGWYNSVQRYAVGQWTMTKSVMTSTPTYTTSGNQNAGVTTSIYKNSTSSSTSYTRTSAMATNVFSSNNAANGAVTCVRLKSATSLSYYVNTSSYGLLPSTKYAYIIIYSS